MGTTSTGGTTATPGRPGSHFAVCTAKVVVTGSVFDQIRAQVSGCSMLNNCSCSFCVATATGLRACAPGSESGNFAVFWAWTAAAENLCGEGRACLATVKWLSADSTRFDLCAPTACGRAGSELPFGDGTVYGAGLLVARLSFSEQRATEASILSYTSN